MSARELATTPVGPTARQALGALKLPPLPAVQLPRLPDVSGLRLPEIQGLWRQLDTDGDGKVRRRHLPCSAPEMIAAL